MLITSNQCNRLEARVRNKNRLLAYVYVRAPAAARGSDCSSGSGVVAGVWSTRRSSALEVEVLRAGAGAQLELVCGCGGCSAELLDANEVPDSTSARGATTCASASATASDETQTREESGAAAADASWVAPARFLSAASRFNGLGFRFTGGAARCCCRNVAAFGSAEALRAPASPVSACWPPDMVPMGIENGRLAH